MQNISIRYFLSILFILVSVLAGNEKAREFARRAKEVECDEEQVVGIETKWKPTKQKQEIPESDSDNESYFSTEDLKDLRLQEDAFAEWRSLTRRAAKFASTSATGNPAVGRSYIHAYMDKHGRGNGSLKKCENLLAELMGSWDVKGLEGNQLTDKKKWNYAEATFTKLDQGKQKLAMKEMLLRLTDKFL